MNRIQRTLAALLIVTSLGSGTVILTAGASEARDTTWGCPTC